MKESTRKLITWIGLGIAIICAVLTIIFAINNGGVKELEAVKANGAFDATFYILLALIIVSLCAILIFAIAKLVKNAKEKPGYLRKFFILLCIVIAVCVVALLASSGTDVNQALMEKHGITEGSSKLIGAACIIVYITVIAAAIAIVFTEIAKSIKK